MSIPPITSRAVSLQRIGLARRLGWGALVMFLLPWLTIVVLAGLPLWRSDLVNASLEIIEELVPFAMLAAPAVAVAALLVRALRGERPGALEVREDHLLVR